MVLPMLSPNTCPTFEAGSPASNVGQVFGLSIGNTITEVPAVQGLSALEIDPEQAAEAYRERIVGPVRALLPVEDVRSIEEQLSDRAPPRSPRSTSSPLCSPTVAPQGSSITSCSTRRRPGTRSGYCSCLDPGPISSTRAREMPPVWDPLQGWRSNAPSMPARSRPWPTAVAPGWFWSPEPTRQAEIS